MSKRKLYELLNNDTEHIFLISKYKTSVGVATKNMHQHNHFEITHYEPADGHHIDCCVYIDNYKYRINSNSYALYPPHLKHKIDRKNSKITRLLINFRHEFADPIADFLDINLNQLFSSPVLNFSDRQLEELNDITDKMMVEYDRNINPSKNSYLKLLFANFLYLLTQSPQKVRPENTKELKINNVIDYITRNYSENLTLDYLSNTFFLSKFELCRKIKDVTGVNFSDYLTQLRINHARELLEESRLTINEISEQIGYHTSSYFSSAFKKTLGVSPNEYRKNFKAETAPNYVQNIKDGTTHRSSSAE